MFDYLKKIEWWPAGTDYTYLHCGECGRTFPKHKSDCELMQAIAELEQLKKEIKNKSDEIFRLETIRRRQQEIIRKKVKNQ